MEIISNNRHQGYVPNFDKKKPAERCVVKIDLTHAVEVTRNFSKQYKTNII